MIAENRADCIMGNHELNILRGELDKSGNGWFSGRSETYTLPGAPLEKPYQSERLTDPVEREEILAFFEALPLALERSDLRVVHAAWQDQAVNALRGVSGSVLDCFLEHEREIQSTVAWKNSDRDGRDLLEQNENPVKLLTSGFEERSPERYFASGKWRSLCRAPWWNSYEGSARVVFGHYWRPLDPTKSRSGPGNLFYGVPDRSWLGRAGRAMCVDYSVGKLYHTRNGRRLQLRPSLAALRMPEEGGTAVPELVFHCGA